MNPLIEQLKRHEGFRRKAYKCSAGKTTIGYGRNLDDVGVSHQEALDMLCSDIVNARTQVLDTFHYAIHIDGVRLDVLINMAFNLGIRGLLKFNKMHMAINEKDFTKASEEMLDSRWATQVGRRAIELSDQMRTGAYR
jgi:lysozyme